MFEKQRARSELAMGRWLSVGCVTAFVALAAVGCGDDQKGTDIVVPAPIAGSAGKGAQGGDSGNGPGSSSGGTLSDGGAPEGGAPEGGASAGTGAASGAGGSGGGKAGAGGTGGVSSGGSAGMSGSAGTSGGGSGGNGGSGGTAGHAGTGGSGGAAGTAGAGGGGSGGGGTGGGGTGGGGTGGGGNGGGGSGSGGGGTGGGGTGGGGSGGGGTCGNGTVEGTEQCDDSGPSRTCSDDCETVTTQECVTCEQTPPSNCFASSDNCKGPSANPFTAQQVGICYDVYKCVQDSNCLDGTGSLGHCYCGDLETGPCGSAPYDLTKAGAPNGPCAPIMQKGYTGLLTNPAILGALVVKSRPAGAAGQRLNCEKLDATCAPICGVE